MTTETGALVESALRRCGGVSSLAVTLGGAVDSEMVRSWQAGTMTPSYRRVQQMREILRRENLPGGHFSRSRHGKRPRWER